MPLGSVLDAGAYVGDTATDAGSEVGDTLRSGWSDFAQHREMVGGTTPVGIWGSQESTEALADYAEFQAQMALAKPKWAAEAGVDAGIDAAKKAIDIGIETTIDGSGTVAEALGEMFVEILDGLAAGLFGGSIEMLVLVAVAVAGGYFILSDGGATTT